MPYLISARFLSIDSAQQFGWQNLENREFEIFFISCIQLSGISVNSIKFYVTQKTFK